MSDPSPAGNTQIVQTNDPWSGVQPALRENIGRVQALGGQPQQYFPNSTVVPFSPETQTGLAAQAGRAWQGSPVGQAGQQEALKTLQGDYLNAGNPAFGAMADRIRGQVQPTIGNIFNQAGRGQSPAHEETFNRTMADALAPLAFQNYSQERGNMQQMAQQSPQFAASDYADIDKLREVGATRETQAGATLQDQINRFNFMQQEPWQRAGQTGALLQGGSFGGTQTTTQPYFSNPLAQGAGGLAALGSTAAMMKMAGMF